jgi:hypothetical protein
MRDDSGAAGGSKALPDPGEAAFFATVELEEGTSLPQLGMGDLWPSCWSSDDALYVAAGDGTGFGVLATDILVAAIEGRPGAQGYRGTQYASGAQVSDVWSGSNYNRKPTGMLCLEGSLYLAVQDLRTQTFDDAPAATIVRSDDKGRSWRWDRKAPMFASNVFTTIMFLDYGKDSEHAPADNFVYAYGLDGNWAFSDHTDGPTQMFLARVPRDHVQDRASWEFFSGFDSAGAPHFDKDIRAKLPVLEDTRRLYAKPLDSTLRFKNMTVINQGGVVYDAPLARYLYASWSEYTFELYESPAPWGPFRLFLSKDFGVWPWNDVKNGGYATTIPSKFISEDGRDMLLQANSWGDVTGKDNYKFSLRKLHVEPYAPSKADNASGPENLATPEHAAVRVVRAARSGKSAVMNDGKTDGDAEDSYNGEAKDDDYWGYTWPKALRINTLRYTTGKQAADGGGFEQLGVQVRRGADWVETRIQSVDPVYPGAATPAFTTYTLHLETTETDGVRIHGKPLGTDHFTSIAELSVHLE